jgi:hypothetical protein
VVAVIDTTEDVLVVENSVGDEVLDETVPLKYSITSYGADYPVDGLVKRISDGSIMVPEFQRGFVWSYNQASRFIESLLLGLPVPGIFLSKEYESQKLLVIDGQQRLRTLQFFYQGVFADSGREFRLRGLSSQYEGITYSALSDEDRRQLDDSIIHATIVRQDEPSDDNSSIFHIFERLNSGGLQLQSQEIRSAIFQGEFNDLLKELNHEAAWRELFGPLHRRMRDQELILRFFALYFNGDNYSKPMKEFLNQFMGTHRYLEFLDKQDLDGLFTRICRTILMGIGKEAFKPKRAVNAAVYDAVMVGIARRLERGDILDLGNLKRNYTLLIETSTSDEENVRRRIELATKAFESVD